MYSQRLTNERYLLIRNFSGSCKCRYQQTNHDGAGPEDDAGLACIRRCQVAGGVIDALQHDGNNEVPYKDSPEGIARGRGISKS